MTDERSQTDQTINQLKQKRTVLKSQLTRFKTFIDNFNNEVNTIGELNLRLEKVSLHLERFDEVQIEIEHLSGLSDDVIERQQFEDAYYTVLGRANQIVHDLSENSSNHSSHISNAADNNANVGPATQVRLPPVNLPEFHGSYNQWLNFVEIFNSLIESNSSLTNIQKFWYLKSCLKGEASQLIQSLEITDNNYVVGWELLKSRYENKRLIVHTHIKALFDIQPLKFESHTHLRTLLDNFNKHYRSLVALGQPAETWNTLLIFIMNNKLDSSSKREWEEYINRENLDFPEIKQFIDFLSKRCNFLETLDSKDKHFKGDKGSKLNTLTHVSTKIVCAFCNKNHLNFQCQKIINMPHKELHQEIKRLKLCINCLRPFHNHIDCKSNGCKHCGRKHNTLLHLFPNKNENKSTEFKNIPDISNTPCQNSSENSERQTDTLLIVDSISDKVNKNNKCDQTNKAGPTRLAMHCVSKNNQIILATAMIKIVNSQGDAIEVRAILDSASQSNFMTNKLARILGIKPHSFNIPVAGINDSLNKISKRVTSQIFSLNGKYNTRDSFLLIEKITENLPQISFDLTDINIPQNIDLADKDFNISRPVDVLLGASIFFDVLCVGQIRTGIDKPLLQKTRLGWIFTGTLSHNSFCNIINSSQKTLCNLSISNNDLNKQIERFWIIENCENSKANLSPEDLECERHFVENYKRISHGRFEVGLPLKNNINKLGDSMNVAIKQFFNLEKRLDKNTELKQAYSQFMLEYENLGHMSVIDKTDLETNALNYYLPHHGVIKEDSTTTKLRVVFNASSKTDSGLSLNDVLMAGPTIQPDLMSIILNFRIHNVVLTGDIEKMYRQVSIRESDRNLQRIVWRANSNNELKHYTLNTVTYGTSPASFLAIRSLNQSALDNLNSYPEAAKAILTSFYVDDLLVGTDNIKNAINLKNDISKILNQAGFPLRKFCSNENAVVSSGDERDSYELSDDKKHKTLGLFWNPKQDILNFSTKINPKPLCTKREILSTIAKIFDPLGLVGPVTISAKIIMQKLWLSKIGWDESVPQEIYSLWKSFFDNLQHIGKIQVLRQVTVRHFSDISLHGFCDASQMAYAACIYLVSTDANGVKFSNLLCAKSRVAPLKTVSLPRLELCGGLLLAKLLQKVSQSLNINFKAKYFWCDSTITLCWIYGEPNSWNTFVANRVAQIQELSGKNLWRHVSTKQNPADILTRGLTPQQINDCSLWWHGPSFIRDDESLWPVSTFAKIDDIPEKRAKFNHVFLNKLIYKDQSIFKRYSGYMKLIRVFAYVCRFKHNARKINKNNRFTAGLSRHEIDTSLLLLVKMVQRPEYYKEINDLKNNREISRDSKLFSLKPFLENDVLRVGGRLAYSTLTPDIKYPIILPPYHEFTKLLIKYEHVRNLHLGTQSLLALLRNKYWIIHGKNAVKQVIHKCIICFRAKPFVCTPIMGNLPKARLMPSRPFLTIGCDFAGPIMVKDGKLRTRKIVKTYVCIFICFVTHAVHIELVGDLSTEAFMGALRRFVSRRGLCKDIYSDNATNFKGASKELSTIINLLNNALQTNEMTTYLLENDIHWHFIPPRAPSFGGLWESAVKSMKFHLTRVLRDAHLTYESLTTILCQIESIMNSRPLTPLSCDPQDFQALTPSHFLIGDLLTAIPQRDVTELNPNKLKLYDRLQQLLQHFWRRWCSEYLTSLQPRKRWQNQIGRTPQVGDLVILQEDNLPPQQWIMGRIITLHPGKDDIVRVVTIQTKTGQFKRSITKIRMLPCNED